MTYISVHQGESKVIPITIVDADNDDAPVDVTDCTVVFVVASKLGKVIELSSDEEFVAKSDPTNGGVEASLVPSHTANLKHGNYKYEVIVTDIEGHRYVAAQGDLFVLPSLTTEVE